MTGRIKPGDGRKRMACMEQDHRDRGIEYGLLATYNAAKAKRIFLGSRHPGTRRLARRRFGVEGWYCSLGLPSTCAGTACFSYTLTIPMHRKNLNFCSIQRGRGDARAALLSATSLLLQALISNAHQF